MHEFISKVLNIDKNEKKGMKDLNVYDYSDK